MSREPMKDRQAVVNLVTASLSSSCDQIASTALPNATVTAVRAYAAGEFTSGRTFKVPAFCRVMVTSRPTPYR
jgi:hypothetical protein